MAALLGLDIGGSSCTAAAFDATGAPLAAAVVEYPMVRPRPGWLEFDPELQWRALRQAVRQVTANEAVRRIGISAMAISVAGDAVVPVDRRGRPLYNSIATPDPRGGELVGWWEERLGARRVFEISGQPLDGSYALNRVLWFRREMPDLYAETWKFLCWHDLLLVRLGLPPVIDPSLAARTMAFDIRRGDWSAEILAAADVAVESFAELAPAGTVVGRVAAAVAADLGLPAGVQVVTGAFDQVCAALSAGAVDEGATAVGCGSVEALLVPVATLPDPEPLRAANFAVVGHAVPGRFLVLGCSFAAGSLVRWYRDQLGGEERRLAEACERNVFELISESVAAEPTELLVLPHFAGGFSPIRDPTSKAAILGLTLTTTRSELLRGLLEGTALELRLMIESLGAVGRRPGPLRVVGGGANSRPWLQIKADVLDREVTAMRVTTEGGCLAAAILAAAATGVHPSIPAAVAAMVHPGPTFVPTRTDAARYRERYALYRRLYPAVAHLQRALGDDPTPSPAI